MRIQNTNPEIVTILDQHTDKEVRITVKGPVVFTWSGVLGYGCNGWTITRPNGPEITFEESDVRKLYVDPAKILSIYF